MKTELQTLKALKKARAALRKIKRINTRHSFDTEEYEIAREALKILEPVVREAEQAAKLIVSTTLITPVDGAHVWQITDILGGVARDLDDGAMKYESGGVVIDHRKDGITVVADIRFVKK